MKEDLFRLTGILLIALFLGLMFGYISAFLVLGLLVYVYQLLHALKTLVQRLHRQKGNSAEDRPGLINDIAREFDYQRLQHKRREQKLASFIKRFKTATRSMPDAVVVVGENDEIEWANTKAEEYLGIRSPQDNGQRVVNLVRNPGLIEFMKQVKLDNLHDSGALDIVSPVNGDVHLELRVVPYAENGKLLVTRDITKIYRINRMRTDFIANASHELRTPLTVISGYLETLEDELLGIDGDKHIQHVRHMRKQTERMRRLIEDLLKLSSLETTEQINQIETEPVRVPDLIKNIIDEAKEIRRDVRHRFVLKIDNDLWLEGDRNQIYSVISNIIYNAVQHTPDKGVITVRWFLQADEAVFETADSGEGIGREHIPRITERFYRADRDRSRERGGTGLGLAIVKHILARYKARLEIESQLGEGSLFRCCFPASLAIRKGIIIDKSDRAAAFGSRADFDV